MPLVEPVVKIENVVACAALKHVIDLSAVVKAFPEVNNLRQKLEENDLIYFAREREE